MNARPHKRRLSWSGFAFVLLTALPLIGTIVHAPFGGSLNELRTLAEFPRWQWSAQSIEAFPDAFHAWYDDHFWSRPILVRAYNTLRIAGMNQNYDRRVVIGREGWLYFNAGDGLIDDYRSPIPLTDEQLDARRTAFEQRRTWLDERGIRYLLVIVPDKHTIYPDFLPANVNPPATASYLDQIVDYFSEDSNLELLDLREPLIAAKSQYRLYSLTDTHWNEIGAYIAAHAIQERVAQWFPGVELPAIDACEITWKRTPGRDLARMLGLENTLREDFPILTPPPDRVAERTTDGVQPSSMTRRQPKPPYAMETGQQSLPHAVVFHDSFGDWLVPYLAPQYQRSVYYWQYAFDNRAVEHERPDIVIDQVVERVLIEGVPPNPIPMILPQADAD